jgi:hypothetical protein
MLYKTIGTLKYFISLFLVIIVLCSCREADKGTGRNLAGFPKTRFIPTIEHFVSRDTNLVYCATLLYAWQEVRDIVDEPLQVDRSFKDLYLLNASRSYMNTLQEDEFLSGAEKDGNEVLAWASFEKSLPFESSLTSFDNELMFQNKKVASFGVFGRDVDHDFDVVDILYYKNHDNFLLKLKPKDKNHEIFLDMTDGAFQSLSDLVRDVELKQKSGENEKRVEELQWKFFFAPDDEVVIPKIDFNIETNYASLEGKVFTGGEVGYRVRQAWQRVKFSLDEKGAELESEAVAVADSVGIDEEIRPKIMRFDKPFFLMLKRTDSRHPYFCLWVANTELMRETAR